MVVIYTDHKAQYKGRTIKIRKWHEKNYIFKWIVSCFKIHCVTLSVLEKFNTKFNAIPIYKVNVFYGAEKI